MPQMDIDQRETTLYARGIAKSFGSTRALKGIDFVIKPGEIHGLLGQNGCGKSTFIKVLAGYHEPDAGGELWLNGEKIPLPIEPGGFIDYGISFVHQDLGLIPTLSVIENWTLGKMSTNNIKYVNWKKEKEHAKAIFERYGLDIDPETIVMDLGPVQKAMLAIIRAVVSLKVNKIVQEKKRGLLVLDEPTVFLPRAEVNTLFSLVREIASEGISVMFVSHDIDEVIELTDAFTVLRDGLNVGEGITKQVTKDKIIEIILGQKLDKYHVEEQSEQNFSQDDVIEADNIKGLIVDDISFKVHPGEVVGITGLVGSGFEEIPYLLCGATDYQRGKLSFDHQQHDLSGYTPKKAVHDGISLIPADRAGSGGIGDLTVEDNLNMQVMYKYRPKNLKRKKMHENAVRLVKQYDVRPDDPGMNFSQLSGGNQQKVLMAKWVQESPKLLILHEPSQGVDVGARQQIYRHVADSAEDGTAVICSSSDYEELTQICNRVIILVRGKIIAELVGSQITKENITKLCFQTSM
ncbi:MAG: sugar ABC transporter ATP-binding protein [Eubacterium sp.]|nr:sugar ABC transporter ATP-binding protein [Eubacterium sp.]